MPKNSFEISVLSRPKFKPVEMRSIPDNMDINDKSDRERLQSMGYSESEINSEESKKKSNAYRRKKFEEASEASVHYDEE